MISFFLNRYRIIFADIFPTYINSRLKYVYFKIVSDNSKLSSQMGIF